MDYQLKGKLAYVSAGAHGIGEAVANLLTEEGVSVIVADHDEDALQEKGHAWKGTFFADLSTAQGVAQAISYVFRSFGKVAAVNASGTSALSTQISAKVR